MADETKKLTWRKAKNIIRRSAIISDYRKKIESGMEPLAAQNWLLDKYSPGPPFKLDERKKINAIVDSKEGVKIARSVIKPEVWNVHSLDVWGNEDDGFEVNNEFKAGEVEIPYAATDEELLQIFKEDHLKPDVTLKMIEFDSHSSEGFFAVVDAKTSEPLYHVYQKRD